MAYTSEEKENFAVRVEAVKAALKQKDLKYYGSAVRGIDSSVKPKLLNNVMNGQCQNEKALLLLEQVAGIRKPEMAEA